MKKRKTTQEFNEQIQELSNGEFELIGEYKRKDIKVKIKHLKCGGEFNILPLQLLDELQCKVCKEKINLYTRYNINSTKDYVEYIKTKTNEFDIISELDIKNNNIKIFHHKCGIEQNVKATKFIKNQICRYCDGGKYVDFLGYVKKVYNKWNTEYVVIDRENNNFKFVHTKCGTKFSKSAAGFFEYDKPCPHCDKNTEWNLLRAKKEIKNITQGEFICTDKKYVDIDTPILIRHLVCNNEFQLSTNVFLKTPKCPVCESNISLGEKLTGKAIHNLGLEFERQYVIPECKRVYALRFDFGIFDLFNNFICLVEYDGEQHYIPMYNNNTDNLKDNMERDKIKNKYCAENNIKLIRIPFWEINNVESILKKEFRKLKVI